MATTSNTIHLLRGSLQFRKEHGVPVPQWKDCITAVPACSQFHIGWYVPQAHTHAEFLKHWVTRALVKDPAKAVVGPTLLVAGARRIPTYRQLRALFEKGPKYFTDATWLEWVITTASGHVKFERWSLVDGTLQIQQQPFAFPTVESL